MRERAAVARVNACVNIPCTHASTAASLPTSARTEGCTLTQVSPMPFSAPSHHRTHPPTHAHVHIYSCVCVLWASRRCVQLGHRGPLVSVLVSRARYGVRICAQVCAASLHLHAAASILPVHVHPAQPVPIHAAPMWYIGPPFCVYDMHACSDFCVRPVLLTWVVPACPCCCTCLFTLYMAPPRVCVCVHTTQEGAVYMGDVWHPRGSEATRGGPSCKPSCVCAPPPLHRVAHPRME